jgi:hypothetical protein
MVISQFWTLVGVLVILGGWVILWLKRIEEAIQTSNFHAVATQDQLRGLQGTLSGISIDLEAIKWVAQRDPAN